MFEDYEGLSGSPSLENHDRLSDSLLNYIEEVLPLHNDNLLAERIDELDGYFPPKAIDSDKDVAMLIESVKEEISPLYLEAPQDGIQIEEISDMMTCMEGLEFSEWKELSYEERMEVLQKVEFKIGKLLEMLSMCPHSMSSIQKYDIFCKFFKCILLTYFCLKLAIINIFFWNFKNNNTFCIKLTSDFFR